MSFSSMAINNIKKRASMYLIYYVSTTFAVTIYYIFSAIYYNPSFANMHTGFSKMGIIFQVSSIAVILFAAVFVYFANMLFLKNRKKEFAIYFLLGIRKKEIGQILVTEICLVGFASVVSGIFVGSIFSRFFALILKKLMLGGAPGNNIVFHLTWQPTVASLLVFAALFVINAAYSVRVINKSSLLDLLSAEKEGEKEPKFSVISAVLSIILIGVSYAIFLSFSGDQGALVLMKPALLSCALLVIGTYLLFQNVVIWLVSKCKKNIAFYYRINNFISISQIVYRIKTNANLFCVIALCSAFTITIMSAAISLYQSLHDAMPIYAPFSYLCHGIGEDEKEKVIACVREDEVAKLSAITDFDVLTTEAQLDGYKVDTNNASGKTVLEMGEKFSIDIIRLSDYDSVVRNTKARQPDGNKGAIMTSDLPQGECLFLDGNYGHEYSDDKIGKEIQVQTDAGYLNFKIAAVSLHKYMGSAYARTTLVLTDADYEQYFAKQDDYKVRNFFGINLDNPLETQDLYNTLDSMIQKEHHDESYLGYHQILYNMYGAYIFIGMFLGVLFLMAAGSIIFYKQMMEARDDVGRYEILRNIGMTYKEVKMTISRQVGIVFLLPFVVALCHALVTLKMYENMVYTLTTDSAVLAYALGVMLIYIVIYLLFYGLSIKGYMNTIWRKSCTK